MIATPRPGPLGSGDRRAHLPRRDKKRHADLVRGHACLGLLTHTGTHLARVVGLGNVPMAEEHDCLVCGDRIAVGRDGKVLWTEAQEERATTDGRNGGGAAHRKEGR